ncbi:glutathione S-transferase family protein [Roseobacteraceae bacterium S113]
MLILKTFPGSFNLPSHSPFCAKAMALLKMADVRWRPEYVSMPRGMPYGRLPVMQVGDRLIPESRNIQTYLEGQGAQFWRGTSGKDRARAHGMIRIAEESLRLGLVHDRWLDEACWPKVREAFFGNMPAPLRAVIPELVRRDVRKGLLSNGLARLSEADRLMRLEDDLDAFAEILWDSAFLLGDHPTAADAAVAPVLTMIAKLPADTALRRAMRARPQLSDYVIRAASLFEVSDVSV